METVKLKNTETYANCEQGKYNAVVTKIFTNNLKQ